MRKREMGEVKVGRRIRKRREEELGSQGRGLWEEIRGYAGGGEKKGRDQWEEGGGEVEEEQEEVVQQQVEEVEVQRGIFWDACFLLGRFTKKQVGFGNSRWRGQADGNRNWCSLMYSLPRTGISRRIWRSCWRARRRRSLCCFRGTRGGVSGGMCLRVCRW